MNISRICEQCGHTYTAKRSAANIRFCSRECWRKDRAAKPVTLICESCGKTYQRSKADIGKGRFCSLRCAGIGNAKTQPPAQVFTYTCQQCGETFIRDRNRTYKFCSRACSDKGRSQPRGITTVAQICEQCGNPYQRIPQTIGRFCSQVCWGKWHSEHDSGENSPYWNGGITEFRGLTWADQSAAARARDHYSCQHCGVTEDQLGQRLDVHHIKPFREFAHIPGGNENDRLANALGNLITLCRSCHLKIEPRKPPHIIKMRGQ